MKISEKLNIKYIDKIQPINVEDFEDKESDILNLSLKHNIVFLTIEDIHCIATTEDNLFNSLKFINSNFEIFNDKELFLITNEDLEALKKIYLETKYYQNIEQEEDTDTDDISDIEELLKTNFDLLTDSENDSPIIKLLNSIIYNAIQQSSSDIHLEAHEKEGRIRFRVNGILDNFLNINNKIMANLSNRIKYLSLLNSSEKRKAQDGNITVNILNEKIDIRISIIPTYYGERIVLRILMNSSKIPEISSLGFDSNTMETLNRITSKSYGIFLVAGPTGSGKTTTLHSFLKEKNSKDINIITVEDPIEYKTDYANQIQVGKNKDFGFAEALRSVLRQDPDVLMIGEMRDKETADIAIKASLTGHYVLSSIHANDSITCLSRLLDMGIDKFLLKDSILGILSQRLVRKSCSCTKEGKTGCSKCNFSGYDKREIVYELLEMTDDIKNSLEDFSYSKVLEIAKKEQSFVSMKDRMESMLKNKEITLEEYNRTGL
jgi:general secretion pathway protein E